MKNRNYKKIFIAIIIISIIFQNFYVISFKDGSSGNTQKDFNFSEIENCNTIPNSQNIDYNHLDYIPFGFYIQTPSYIERFVNSEDKSIKFELINDFGGYFEKVSVSIDGEEIYNRTMNKWDNYNSHYYDIPDDIMNDLGIHEIIYKACHFQLNKNITSISTLNITNENPCFKFYFDDFNRNQNSGFENLKWKVLTNESTYYNFYFFINGSLLDSHESSNEDITINYKNLDDQYSYSVGEIYEFKLKVVDEEGYQTVNEFNMTIVGNEYPQVETFNSDNDYYSIWESNNFNLILDVNDLDYDLDKIYIFFYNYPAPFLILEDIDNYNNIKIPINSFKLNEFIAKLDFNIDHLIFSTIAVDKSGKSSWNGILTEIWNFNDYSFLTNKEEYSKDMKKGQYVYSYEIKYLYHSDLKFKLTTIIKTKSDTKFSLISTTAEHWESKISDRGFHSFYERGDLYEVFEGFNYEENWIKGGLVFWIRAENISAINFPIEIKVTYPKEIEPDKFLEEPPLNVLKYVAETPEWYTYSNLTISRNGEERDESIQQVDLHSVKFYVYEPGLYAFGMDALAYKNKSDEINRDFISGYNFEFIVSFISISILILSYQLKKKKKKR